MRTGVLLVILKIHDTTVTLTSLYPFPFLAHFFYFFRSETKCDVVVVRLPLIAHRTPPFAVSPPGAADSQFAVLIILF
uniref:Uncharacterized protein n=1 Tax=Kalanchoe fedtschenkoi TaxID=63787 RepID=A0A7N0VCH3_KALFE